ncbi:MAG: hypothetical protein U5L00_00155 [Desulfovermiculus sp.]|nr:hypothetical protein [Desulfovermiculus sp.]
MDSTFLAAAARTWRLDYLAVFLAGPHISPEDRQGAEETVSQLGPPFIIQEFSPLDVPGASINERDRCYHCKTALIGKLKDCAGPGRMQVMDGSHLSDTQEYRPGLRALTEQGVLSPLADAGMAKEDIRVYARRLGLEQAEQPSRPCLMTRFAYGYAMSARELLQVGRAEDELRKTGLSLFRIRIFSQGRILLHVHYSQEDMLRIKGQAIDECMEQSGLSGFSLELVQNLSGYFDRCGPKDT